MREPDGLYAAFVAVRYGRVVKDVPIDEAVADIAAVLEVDDPDRVAQAQRQIRRNMRRALQSG